MRNYTFKTTTIYQEEEHKKCFQTNYFITALFCHPSSITILLHLALMSPTYFQLPPGWMRINTLLVGIDYLFEVSQISFPLNSIQIMQVRIYLKFSI